MVYTFNNTEYILLNIIVIDGKTEKIDNAIKKHGCIIQDFNIMRTNLTLLSFLFGTTKIKVSVLVPTKNLDKFNDEID